MVVYVLHQSACSASMCVTERMCMRFVRTADDTSCAMAYGKASVLLRLASHSCQPFLHNMVLFAAGG